MTVAMKKQLDESLRDAQLAFYLDKVVPDNGLTGTARLKTAQDLYEYWLLDVLVSQDVPTTPVACAIASLQQYINRILMNMEPGYDRASITPEHLQTWRNEMHQYAIWAAHQKLLYFPASYLDPILRNNKSDNFQQLENALNQNRIQADAVQSAVMAYLTRFEEMANLNILNGYIDGEDFANSTYYFIAKSRTENTYFWRSLDMGQRPVADTPPLPPATASKLDGPAPFAWSDWEKADVPIPETAVEHSIRPVRFNNRLFIVWAECIHQDPTASSTDSAHASAEQAGTSHPLLRLSFCFKKQNGNWSAPRIGLQGYCEDKAFAGKNINAIKPLLCTVAEHHITVWQDLLFLSLGAKADKQPASGDNCIFLRTACINKDLSVQPYLSDPPPQKTELDLKQLNEMLRKKLLDANDRRIQTNAALRRLPITHENNEINAFLPATLYFLPLESVPQITEKSLGGQGTVQYLDFSLSAFRGRPSQPIRLNTTFAAELIRRTENGLDELFDWTTQHLSEPVIPDAPNNNMDFHGPYGRYFTELFLYLPWLVAHRLNAEQRYEEAERWLRRLFDPGRGKENCWRALPLLDSSTPSYADQAPHDPHQIALSHPAHFRKALYFLYLDILINRGDAAYRELTPDGLSEAKLWYVRVLDLLGPRPTVQSVDHWVNINLKTLGETTSDDLRTFERSLARSQPSLPARGGSLHASWPAIDSPHLRLPFNPQLLQCWDIAESRLYNLRHNLDIAGKPLHLPVFAVPLDPRVLLSPAVLNTSSNTVQGLPTTSVPHYRFSVMHSQALSAVESLSQFGATLLSLVERKEQAQLQELQQQQAWNLAKISVDLQRQALNIDRQNRQALLASQAIAQNRSTHYKKLLDDGLSNKEISVSWFNVSSGTMEAAAMAFQVAAAGLMLVPNVAGFSFGGSRWEGPALAASAAAHSSAIITRTIAADLDRQAIFDRRREDWQHAYDQSQLELTQIDAQLAQSTEQETATRLQLRLAESTLSQTKTYYDFLSKRFTKAQLYQWLNSQFAALYRQAYDTTLSLCLAAEHCWQYEIGDCDTRFIQPGVWNTTYRGLGAGEQLKLSLLNMQAGYLRRSERELEIRKTISLRQLKDQTATSTINEPWLDMHAALKKGQCDFELPHDLFENDYKGQKHYLRRIKTISVSLPAIVGPYENIRATLTQTSSKVYMSADAKGRVMENLRANQQIALSTGVDDNGLFTLTFNDERYLPFEYTGAVSKWQLTFPNPEAQRDMLESLTDIIVHVSYTARVGGAQ
ncbi:neuraminidase-like domain-containing protein [Pseudomonas sp. CFII68]|uniref:Tc toxin subunit A-related protein n=1 Tax=Pseudomonas sp. CFII68 TaxID=911243 RepID=UPI00035522CA|nr:neuraminidase-like domain-containing protein [Pseudomonas sp. CFII68]EPJ78405.1 putative insecticidal toxin protein [Pseudomonas sp. CFII68]